MSIKKKQNSLDSYLRETLELVIFNEDELDKLKKIIDKFELTPNKSKMIKEHLINNYMRILKEILEFIPFFVKREMNNLSIDAFANEQSISNSHQDLLKELEEKNIFFNEINNRIDILYEKLLSKVNK